MIEWVWQYSVLHEYSECNGCVIEWVWDHVRKPIYEFGPILILCVSQVFVSCTGEHCLEKGS